MKLMTKESELNFWIFECATRAIYFLKFIYLFIIWCHYENSTFLAMMSFWYRCPPRRPAYGNGNCDPVGLEDVFLIIFLEKFKMYQVMWGEIQRLDLIYYLMYLNQNYLVKLIVVMTEGLIGAGLYCNPGWTCEICKSKSHCGPSVDIYGSLS